MTIEHAPIPTRETHGSPRSQGPVSAGPGGRIVVGVDGSTVSLADLRWAITEGSRRGVHVHALGVWSFTGGRCFHAPADEPTPGDVLVTAVQETVAAATATTPDRSALRAVTVTVSVIQGDPVWELPAAVGEGRSVVGPRGHGRRSG